VAPLHRAVQFPAAIAFAFITALATAAETPPQPFEPREGQARSTGVPLGI